MSDDTRCQMAGDVTWQEMSDVWSVLVWFLVRL